jgi:CzcA family heavy metal efflux pump
VRWIVSTALRLRVAVVALTAVVIYLGAQSLRTMPFDVFPEFAPPLVEIQTEAPGLSTEQVEALITVPLESALTGTPWLSKIRSKSVLGLSQVVLYFQPDTDRLRVRQIVQERIARATALLPDVARPPTILSPISSLSRVLKIGMWSRTRSQTELTTVAKWTVRPRLMAIGGVANVSIFGERERQIQVQVDPDRLRASHVTLADVRRAAGQAVALSGGGFIDTANQRLAVTHASPVSGPQDLAQAVVAYRSGAALRLGDVAEVVDSFAPPIGDAIVNDVPGLLLIVEKQPWGNTLEVTRNVERTLRALEPALVDIELDATIFRPATFIEMSLANLNRAILAGCLLVVLVLALFLNDWRTALISMLAIPASLLTAILILGYRGGTIDTMVLAGLIIALGEVMDDAIIDVENIFRRLRLNRARSVPEPAVRVVLAASLEVRSAVLYGSLIVVLVLLPVFFLEGLAGTFFRPLAFSYVLAILSSLLVALTLTPALSLLLLSRAAGQRAAEAPLVRWLKSGYRRLLPRVVERPLPVLVVSVVALAAALITLPFLGEEFLPRFREYDFLMHWVGKPGTSLAAMDRITVRASRELRSIPGVRNFGSHIGRAVEADEIVGPNFTELWISLDPGVAYEPTVARLQEVVDGYPGLQRDLLTYLRERIKEVLTGTSASIVVRVYGPNLDDLGDKAREVERTLAGIAGVSDLKLQQQIRVPQVEVRWRPEAAARFGLTPGTVLEDATTLLNGRKVGEVFLEQKRFDVAVIGAPAVRGSVESVRALRIDTPGGGQVPLGEVAEVRVAAMPNEITREAASRRIDVTCNVRGRDLASVAREIEAAVAAIPFASGYYPEVIGEYAEQRAARNRILALAAFSALGIFLILYTDFGSTRLALVVFLGLPFALVGGVGGALLGGGVLSLGSLVGFVTVLGIAARNGIMLVSHYRHLRTDEGLPFGRDLVLRGAEERLAPILMTALNTSLALLPIVLGGIRPGYEIEHPMAVVIVSGLITSAVLNLFLIPTLYLRFGRGAGREPAASLDTAGAVRAR